MFIGVWGGGFLLKSITISLVLLVFKHNWLLLYQSTKSLMTDLYSKSLNPIEAHASVRQMMVNKPGPVYRDGLEDPLDDAGLVQQQLDQLSTIGRCEYEKTCALLVQLFDQAAQTYQELLQSTNSSSADITVQEGPFTRPLFVMLWFWRWPLIVALCAGRLTWLVYIIGAVIGGRVSFASTDEQDAMDGELVCR